jgi:hypothetical protein
VRLEIVAKHRIPKLIAILAVGVVPAMLAQQSEGLFGEFRQGQLRLGSHLSWR